MPVCGSRRAASRRLHCRPLHRPARRRLLRGARRCDRFMAAAPLVEDGDPAADAVLAQTRREALMRHADDDEADPDHESSQSCMSRSSGVSSRTSTAASAARRRRPRAYAGA
jgi:hypothetical protein